MDSYKITFQSWDKVASVYQEYFMDLDLYDDTYDDFCRLVTTENARIFEIGCGPGNITRYLLSKRPGFKIEAIDTSPNMIRLAEENNPAASFRVMDCREIDTITSNFAAVVCGFCMPYLSKADCLKLIKDCSALLNSAGVLYFSTIEGSYSQSGYETDSKGEGSMYVYYHEEGYLQDALNTYGFGAVQLKRKDYLKRDGTASVHMIFIAQKQ